MAKKRSRVTIYTDGGADPNPGPGGWAAILIHGATGKILELSGGEPETTNNRMELTAAIKGLEALKTDCDVVLYTDSRYLQQGITEWVDAWIKKGWFRGTKEVRNVDLWKRLADLRERHNITWKWVKGHDGNPHNERADALATEQIRVQTEIYKQLNPADVDIVLRVACLGDKGGWAAYLTHAGAERIISGRMTDATPNRLDILAAIEALKLTPENVAARIYTASKYLRDGATIWLSQWKANNWRTKTKDKVKNRLLWEELDSLLETRHVDWVLTTDDSIAESARLAEIARTEAKHATYPRDAYRYSGR